MHRNTPLVTAVVPVYNHERFVVESIRSIINQTYHNMELIVVNDGSKDRSHELIMSLVEECRNRFVRFEYINRHNVGLSSTLNQALGLARGKYLTALASDDVELPEKTAVLVEALESNKELFAVAFGDALYIDDSGSQIALDEEGHECHDSIKGSYTSVLDFLTRNKSFDYRSEEFGSYRTLLMGNYLPAISGLARTSAIVAVGGWTPGNMVDDWEMWLKLSKQFRFMYVDRPLALYRRHDSNMTKVSNGKLRCAMVTLLSKERRFCVSSGLADVWREEYVGTLSVAVKDSTIPLSKKLSLIDLTKTGPVVSWITKQLWKKLPIARRCRL